MTTLQQIFDEFTAGSTGFCIAVETHCGFGISRKEIARIASRARTADEFVSIWTNEDWWADLERWFMQMRRESTPEYLNAEINELLNSTESEVDEDGSVWICNPQTGHWASETELADIKRMIEQNS
jgi:hypothetical protein